MTKIEKIYRIFRKIAAWLRNEHFYVYDFLWRFAWPPLLLLMHFYWNYRADCEYRVPTAKMLEAKNYYHSNHDRVKTVCSYLADDESRRIYKAMICFRMTHNRRIFPSYNVRTKYFDNDFFEYKDGEVLIDCGACVGGTLELFIDVMKKRRRQIRKIVAFEPEDRNFQILSSNYRKLKDRYNIKLLHRGVWNEDGVLTVVGEWATSHLEMPKSERLNTARTARVCRIDDVKECRDATFIKMDIEGAEMNALMGARDTIVRNKPKLAICIYHSNEDMIRIAEWIHETVPEYKLYVRQHKFSEDETVLYATIRT